MYTKDDVAKLLADIDALKLDPPLAIGEPLSFGLEVDVLDPVTGQITTACRPHRPDIGQTEILMTAAQVASTVASTRHARLQADRSSGVAYLDPQDKADVRAALAARADDEAKRAQDAADAAKARAQTANDTARSAQAEADKAKAADASDPQKIADAKAKVASTAVNDAAKAQTAANAQPADAVLAQAAKDAKAKADAATADAKSAQDTADQAKKRAA